MRKLIVVILITGGFIALTLAFSATQQKAGARLPFKTPAAVASTNVVTNLIAVAPPPFSPDVFPCSECHRPEDAINTVPHDVPDHPQVVFNHDKENRWCLDCHDAKNRDKLHLADGRLIGFEESFKLCGQCHGPELRDWKNGIHGKRTGSWSGQKQYLLCAHCHNPHSPPFKSIQPLPPPQRQETIK